MKMNNDVLSNFIEKDNQWVSDTIEKYPEKIPVDACFITAICRKRYI